jgi:hypothetical protein
VDGIVFFRRVLARQLEDDFGAAGVLGYEARYVVDISVEDYPAALSCVVLCDWFSRLAAKN